MTGLGHAFRPQFYPEVLAWAKRGGPDPDASETNWSASGAQPIAYAHTGVEGLIGVRYVEAGHARQMLNLFWPDEPSATPLPLVITIHCGAWETDGRGGPTSGRTLLARGLGAEANLDYRPGEVAPFPAQIEDCKAAIRWLRAHAKEYNLDPDRFAVAGHSAGSHLAVLLGTSGDTRQFDVGANLDQSSRVQAVVDQAGPIDLMLHPTHPAVIKLLGGPPGEKRALAAMANPLTYLSKDAHVPPFLIVQGEADTTVPLEHSMMLFEP